MQLVQQMVQILVAGLSEMATGIGGGLNELVKSVFLMNPGTEGASWQLSVFGQVILCFGGIALAIGLSRFIVNWVTSWGN